MKFALQATLQFLNMFFRSFVKCLDILILKLIPRQYVRRILLAHVLKPEFVNVSSTNMPYRPSFLIISLEIVLAS